MRNRLKNNYRRTNIFRSSFLITGVFLYLISALPAQAVTGIYNKQPTDTLLASEWNNLISDFLAKSGGSMSGNLAIGTSTSAYALEVNGTVSATNFIGSLSGSVSAANVSSGAFGSNLGGGNYSFPGNVGIGTTDPTMKLHVIGSIKVPDNYGLAGTSYGENTLIPDYSTGGHFNRFRALSGQIFETYSGGTYNEKMRITSTGNIGIGLTNPTSKLQLAQNTVGVGTVSGTAGSATVTGSGTSFLGDFNGGTTITIGSETKTVGNVSSDTSMTLSSPLANSYTNSAYTISGTGSSKIDGNSYARFSYGSTLTEINSNNNGAYGFRTSSAVKGNGFYLYNATGGFYAYNGTPMFYATAANNFGVATTLPTARLHVKGVGATGTSSAFKVDNSADTNLLTILDSGLIGINSSTPLAKLDINPGGDSYSLLVGSGKIGNVGTPTADSDAANKSYVDSALSTATNSIASYWTLNGSNLYASSTSWNVGIGTTSPAYKLHLAGGDFRSEGTFRTGTASDPGRWRFYDASGYLMSFWVPGTDYDTWGLNWDTTDNEFRWMGNGIMRSSIDLDDGSAYFQGNVGIGTTNPQAILDVSGAARFYDSTRSGYIGLFPTSNNQEIVTSIGQLNLKPANGSILIYKESVNTYLTLRNATGDGAVLMNTNGSSYFNGGNLGIGTTTVNTKLTVNNGGAGNAIDVLSSKIANLATPTASTDAANKSYVDSALATATNSIASYWTLNGSNLYASSTAWNVGIGTTNPGAPLEIISSVYPGALGGQVVLKSDQNYGQYTAVGYGTGYYGAFSGAAARGTLASPSASQANDVLFMFGGRGYGTTNWASGSRGTIRFKAEENWTDSAQGTYMIVETTASGGSSRSEKFRITGSGNVGIGTTAPGALLEVVSAGYPVAKIVRSSALTNSSKSSFASMHLTTGDMVDGFGSDFSFMIQDSSGVANEIANFGAVRDGADNQGALVFYTRPGGTRTERMRVANGGNIGIGTTTINTKLTIDNGGAGNAIDVLSSKIANLATPTASTDAANKSYVDTAVLAATSSMAYWTLNGSNLYASSTAWNVGIGNTNPLEKLDIRDGNLYISDSNLSGSDTGGMIKFGRPEGYASTWYSFIKSYTTTGYDRIGLKLGVSLSGGSYDAMTITPDSNVGIGTTTPAQKLDVAGTINSGALGIPGKLLLNYSGDGGGGSILEMKSTIELSIYKTRGRSAELLMGNAYGYDFKSEGVSAMYITNSAVANPRFVGIGTTAPTEKLEVNTGNILVKAAEGTNRARLRYNGDTSGGDLTLYDSVGSMTDFISGDTGTASYINNGGNFGIGTTTVSTKLTVNNGGAGSAIDVLSSKIANLATPTASTDAANKSYVDSALATATNSIASYWTLSGSNLYASSTAWNVGIGTTNPGNKLHILDSGNIHQMLESTSTSTQYLTYSLKNASQQWQMGLHGDVAQFRIRDATAGTYPFVINSSTGNIGIGITNPVNKLAVSGDIFIDGTVGDTTLNGFQIDMNRAEANYINATNALGYFYFRVAGGNNAMKLATNSDAIFYGNVGIGTTTPSTKLHVYDAAGPTIKLSGDALSDNSTIQFDNFHRIRSNSNNGTLDFEAGYSGNGHKLRFFTDQNERMRVESSGRVGIGTTTINTKLTVDNGGTGSAIDVLSSKIANLATPTASTDAANKSYVDTAVLAATSSMAYWTLNGSTLYASSTAWSLGVGTTNPTYKLDVAGNAMIRGAGTYNNNANSADLQIGYGIVGAGGAGSVSRLAIQPYGHTGGPFKFVARDTISKAYLDINYGSSNLFTFDAAGMVGVGTTSPGSLLSLNGTSTIAGGITFNSLNTGFFSGYANEINAAVNGSTEFRLNASYLDLYDNSRLRLVNEAPSATNPVFVPYGNDDDTGLGYAATNVLSLIAGGVNGLNVNSSASVGIGTTTINTKLTIDNGGAGNAIDVLSSKIANLATPTASTDAANKSYVDSALATATNSIASYWTLNGSNLYASSTAWNVGVGTTDPTYKLDVSGTFRVSASSSSIILDANGDVLIGL